MTMPVPASGPGGAQPSTVLADRQPGLPARLAAEALGTLFVVAVGLGVPLFAVPQYNPMSASLAAGLALTAAMLAFGYLSGGHYNPAVTLGNLIAGRIRPVEAAAYLGAQLAGALLGALTLFGILRTVPKLNGTRAAFDTVAAGFDARSVIQAPMPGVLLVEVLGAALLVAVYLGTTAGRNPAQAAAPFAVGLSMAVLLQLGQSIGNAPFNPARATASALFSSPDALGQLWLFWVAPLVGAAVAGLVFRGFAHTSAPLAAAPADPDERDGFADGDDVGDLDDLDDPADLGNRGDTAAAAPARTPAPAPADEARDFFDKPTP